MKNGSVYLSRNVCRTKDLNLKIVYKHQGRKPTTLEWWVVHFAYQNHENTSKLRNFDE